MVIIIEPLFFIPGQQLKIFEIYRRTAQTDNKGRISYKAEDKKIGEFKGSISSATQKQINKWKQIKHPITHTVVVRGTCEGKAEDILVLGNEKYYIQGKDNPAGLSFFQILYCEKKLEGDNCG